MKGFGEYSGFPESVVAQDAAKLFEAIEMPQILSLNLEEQRISRLPRFSQFPGADPEPGPEPLSRALLAQQIMDSALLALAALKRLEDRAAACKARLVVKIAAAARMEDSAVALDSWQRGVSGMSVEAQIATTLCISERSAGMLSSTAAELLSGQSRTLVELESGAISWGHAGIIVGQIATLSETPGTTAEHLEKFETELLKHAPGSTARLFASKARRLREGHHPTTLQTRMKQAIDKREMSLEPGKDGMSWLTLHLPAPAAEGIWVQCTRSARAQQQVAGEHRTLAQLRIDGASAVLLGQREMADILASENRSNGAGPDEVGADATAPSQRSAADRPSTESTTELSAALSAALSPGAVDGIEEDPMAEYLKFIEADRAGLAISEPPRPDAQVIVTVPAISLLGLCDDPAELAGHGPIPVEVARTLLGESNSFLRVVTDPISGVPLDNRPDTYRVGSRERALLMALSRTCSWPNCSVPAVLSEIDHVEAFASGGRTTSGNLQPLCKRHHTIKHLSDDKDRHGVPRRINEPHRNGIRLRGWKPRKTANGSVEWISPSGKVHEPPPAEHQVPSYPAQLARTSIENPDDPAQNEGTAKTAGPARTQGLNLSSIFEQILLAYTSQRHGFPD